MKKDKKNPAKYKNKKQWGQNTTPENKRLNYTSSTTIRG